MSTSTELVSTTTVYTTTINMPHESTCESHDTTASTGVNSSTIAILGAMGTLFITIVIAIIIMVIIATLILRNSKANRLVELRH